MYRTIKKVLIAVWLLLVVTNVWAQLYPIQVNLTAPGSLPGSIHSLYEANGLKGSIVLLDRYQPTLEVGIGVRIKGNNATIERRSDYLGDPLMLHYGTPVMLGEQVFAPIFQDGITYNGANRDEFERRGALSPGSYEILVWAYDPTRPQVRISNEARCIVWVQQSAPPTLIQPQPNAVVYALPQLFSWTVAQNFPGLNPTKYRFLLYELQDLNRAPESEVLSSEPLYEQELLMPTFAYSTMNAQLTRGKRYAWRIQALAQDMNGREVSLFSNNGFSPVRTFTYGQDAVEYLKKTFEVEPRVSSPYAAEVTWKNVSSLDAPDGMKVEYRKTGASEWQSIEADDEMLTLSQLTPDTEYDIRGIARTGAEYGEAGPVVKFRTQKIPEAKCGPTESYKPDPNSPKLASLVVGDIFTANRVPFVVEEAKGDGTFTGKATSAIPFFGGRKIMFKFSGIALNQKYELLSGSLVADTVGIEKFISKSLQEQNQKLANTLEKKGDLLASEDTKKIDGEIKDATSIKVDTANKQITVTLADGQETIVPFEGKPIIIADSGGKVYSVSDAGAVTSLGMYDGKAAGGATGSGGGVPSAKPQVLSGADLLVAFEAATNQRYGFDDPNGLGGQVWKEKYDEITVGGSKKMVPAKMVAAGSTDVVSVSLKGDAASSDLKDLSFVTSTGMRYTASPSTQKDRLDLTVMGGADASRQELTAWMKKGDSTYAVGRLSIDAYAKKSLRVVLVPVGDVGSAHTAQVATEVARIYRQAGVEVSVTDVPKLPMPEGVSDALKVDKSLMSCYSAGMRSIRSAFTKSETYRKLGTSNVYYLFLVSLPMNGEDENAPFDGYMPYGKPFGFVRSAGMGASELAWTIAHELGHGAFQLQHVWLEPGYDTYTKNLMGYSKTSELFRWQWQDIHHPVPHNNFGADEEDLGAVGMFEPNYVNAANILKEHIESLGFKVELTKKEKAVQIKSLIIYHNLVMKLDKTFYENGDMYEYANFLTNLGVEFYNAHTIEQKTITEKIIWKVKGIDAKLERSKIPPKPVIWIADMVMGDIGMIYNLYKGKHFITGDDYTIRNAVVDKSIGIIAKKIFPDELRQTLFTNGASIVINESEDAIKSITTSKSTNTRLPFFNMTKLLDVFPYNSSILKTWNISPNKFIFFIDLSLFYQKYNDIFMIDLVKERCKENWKLFLNKKGNPTKNNFIELVNSMLIENNIKGVKVVYE